MKGLSFPDYGWSPSAEIEWDLRGHADTLRESTWKPAVPELTRILNLNWDSRQVLDRVLCDESTVPRSPACTANDAFRGRHALNDRGRPWRRSVWSPLQTTEQNLPHPHIFCLGQHARHTLQTQSNIRECLRQSSDRISKAIVRTGSTVKSMSRVKAQ